MDRSPPVRTRPRAVTLTEAGRRFLSRAETLHRQVNEARTDVRAGLQVSVEPLRIAATHSLSLSFFSDWIAAICGGSALDPFSSLPKASPVVSAWLATDEPSSCSPTAIRQRPFGWTPPCSARCWSGSTPWRRSPRPGSPPRSTGTATTLCPPLHHLQRGLGLRPHSQPSTSRNPGGRPASSRSSPPITLGC